MPLDFVLVFLRPMKKFHRTIECDHINRMHCRGFIGVNPNRLLAQVFYASRCIFQLCQDIKSATSKRCMQSRFAANIKDKVKKASECNYSRQNGSSFYPGESCRARSHNNKHRYFMNPGKETLSIFVIASIAQAID